MGLFLTHACHFLVHLIAQDVKDIVFHLIEGEGAGKRSTTELLVVEDIWREIY